MATKTQENGSAAKQETSKTVIAENRGGWSLRRKKKNKQTIVDTPPRSHSADNLTASCETPSPLTLRNIPDTPTSDHVGTDSASPAVETPTANGDMKAGSGVIDSSVVKTPPTEKKASRFAAISRIFKPWKWRRRKKPSEKIEKTAVDLERKISVRTSREELIKRGVLKEVDENGEPIVPVDAPIPEEDEDDGAAEAVKEDGGEYEHHKQANGSANATPTLPHPAYDGELPNAHGHYEGEVVPQTPPPADNTISLSPEYYTRQGSTPVSHHAHGALHHPNYASEEYHRQDSEVGPKQIRVMLPVGDNERQVPVLQKIPIVHDPPDYKPSPPPEHHQHTPIISPAYNDSPMLNNNIYTPTGLTYSTPTLTKQTIQVGMTNQPINTGYVDVPIHEPDLAKKPLRSAIKGAKSKQLLQQQLQAKLQEKQRQLQYAEDGSMDHIGSMSRTGPKVAPKPKVSLINGGSSLSRAHRIDSSNKENEMYDNVPDYDNLHSDDSDDEVQYDDRNPESILAAKVQRSDSLAKFLNHRPSRKVLVDRNILPVMSDKEKAREKELIGKRLTRRLSLRPTLADLENRNIIHAKGEEQSQKEKEEKKKTLVRKLSFRPTVEDLRNRKIIMFSDYVEVTDTGEYDRRADKPWTRLTPKDKASIRKELNEFKSTEMDVHEESRHLTRFHRP